MKDWAAQRGSVWGPRFEACIDALGVDSLWLWDNAAPNIEEVLCGASREALDREFPPDEDGLRIALLDPTRGLPALRLAFTVDDDDHGKIIYLSATPRPRQ